MKNKYNKNETYFESYQKKECEKWIKEHTKKTWLEERYPTEYKDIKTVSNHLAFRTVAKEKYCNEWHTENPTKNGLYLCKIDQISSIPYRVCEWRNEPLNKYDRNWVGQGYTVIKWKEIE